LSIESGVVASTSLYVAHPTTFLEITKVDRNTTYNITVWAYTVKGEGTPSDTYYTTGPKYGLCSLSFYLL